MMTRNLTLPLIILVILMAPLTLFGVTLVGPSDPIQVGEVVDFTAAGLKASESGKALVKWFPRDKVRCKPYIPWGADPAPMIEFSARAPGRYLLSVTTIENGDLCYDEVVITVTGDDPNPAPDPEPDPDPLPGPRKLIVWSESSTRTPELANNLMLLRASSVPYLNLDPTQDVPPALAKYKAAAKDKQLPYFVIFANGGEIVSQGTLPEDWDDIVDELKKGGVSL